VIVCKYMGWSWPEYLACPVAVLEEVIAVMEEERAKIEAASARR
jgi:hypothetical protein